jgi:phenylacetate-CoA ligase
MGEGVKNLLRPLRRLHGSAVVGATLALDRALAVPFLPRARLEAVRDHRVRQIVAYAARHVPYYRALFARGPFAPTDIQGADDLVRLPLLDRELVRAHPERFVADTAAGRAGLDFYTSGSTGTPLRVLHDARSLLANIAWGERERAAVIEVCGAGFRPKELYVGGQVSTFRKVMAFYEESVLFPAKPRRFWMSVARPIEDVIAACDAERPDVLVGYGGWIGLFFKTIEARGLRVHLPKMVMYMAEALPPGARAHIEGRFGVAVLSRYSAAEAFKIGYYCERRTGFHLHEDLCHLRVVGPDGATLPDGQRGQLVLSNLVNRAQVLLNYPIGDLGALADRTCACGRTTRLLSELEGRVEDILELPGGRHVHPRAVWQALKDDSELLQYQLVQREPSRFELDLATVDDVAYRRVLERAMPQLRGLLGADAVIEARRRTDGVRVGAEKFRAVSCLLPRRSAQ